MKKRRLRLTTPIGTMQLRTLSSLLLLLLLLLLLAASPAQGRQEAATQTQHKRHKIPFASPSDNTTTTTIKAPPTTPTNTTAPPTTPTNTTAPPTTPTNTTAPPTTTPTNTTAPPTTPTNTTVPPTTTPTTTTAPPTTTPTTTTAPPTTTTTTAPPTTTPTTTTAPPTEPPLQGQVLYEKTKEELQLITDVLNNFENLVDTKRGAPSVKGSAGRTGDTGAHPVTWWLQGKAARVGDYKFCKAGAYDLCHTLETQLEDTDNVVGELSSDVDGWSNYDLTKLRQERQGLNDTYSEANTDPETFKNSVNKDQFKEVIGGVKQNVQESYDVVLEKINDLRGSVTFVAVLGTVCGLVIISIVSVMVYVTVKKKKRVNKPMDADAQDPREPRPDPA